MNGSEILLCLWLAAAIPAAVAVYFKPWTDFFRAIVFITCSAPVAMVMWAMVLVAGVLAWPVLVWFIWQQYLDRRSVPDPE